MITQHTFHDCDSCGCNIDWQDGDFEGQYERENEE